MSRRAMQNSDGDMLIGGSDNKKLFKKYLKNARA
jgi:hypothetical protein